MTVKCTISLDWRGPACGEVAISMNDYGGFQCEWHDSMKRCEANPPGPFAPISKDDPNAAEKLQAAWDKRILRLTNEFH